MFAGKIVARTSDGDIRIRMIEGIAILKTSDGDLDLGKVEADRFSAHTSDGDINIAQLYGDGEMRTTDGDIYVGALAGSMSSAHSSDGTITISNVEGGLSVTGSDIDVQLHLQAPGKITVATSSGDIKITIPQDHPADLVLRGDDVHMASYVNFEGRMDDEYAKGRINGGGDLIEVHTSDGATTGPVTERCMATAGAVPPEGVEQGRRDAGHSAADWMSQYNCATMYD